MNNWWTAPPSGPLPEVSPDAEEAFRSWPGPELEPPDPTEQQNLPDAPEKQSEQRTIPVKTAVLLAVACLAAGLVTGMNLGGGEGETPVPPGTSEDYLPPAGDGPDELR